MDTLQKGTTVGQLKMAYDEAKAYAVEVTYSQLVALRNESKLIAGRWYRITDYVTTTVQAGTQSAAHAFDIIVRADDVNVLNKNAYATQHSGDTYFANSKLEAWQIKYCLDNDTNKFAWADSTNGKGVIYRMIDEFNNDCPYDFKNIQYVFVQGFTVTYHTYGDRTKVYGRNTANDQTIDGTIYYGWSKTAEPSSGGADLPNDYWTTALTLSTNMDRYVISSGIATKNSNGNVVSYCNSSFTTYTFDKDGNEASISGGSESVFKNNIASYVKNSKQMLNTIYFKITGGGPAFNCYGNSFNTNCSELSFGYGCYSNSFGNSCGKNSFGNGCSGNFFGYNCGGNSFGNNCSNNSFGNGCYSNSFGNSCGKNSFGNGCGKNSFGNYYQYNSFGNCCNTIKFQKDYIYYCIIENGNQNINITSTQTTSSSNKLQNFTIAQGVNNSNTVKTISHNTVNDTFKTTYQNANSQIISV